MDLTHHVNHPQRKLTFGGDINPGYHFYVKETTTEKTRSKVFDHTLPRTILTMNSFSPKTAKATEMNIIPHAPPIMKK